MSNAEEKADGNVTSGRRLYDATKRIQSARLYGDVATYQYYYIDILVGTPLPQRVSVIADTGSTICAFTCSGCQSCGHHLDANFDFSLSNSAQWTPCSKSCHSCRQNRCAYHQSYTEGSSIEGFQFTDFISLGDEFQQNPMVKVHMGCHTKETRLFVTQKANGIMGLAPSERSTVLQEIFKDHEHVNGDIFSMCLSPQGGLLTVGYDSSAATVAWTPMRPQRFYSVSLKKMSLEGSSSELTGFGHTFVDSGTTFTYLPDALFRRLRDLVQDHCQTRCGQLTGSSCWQIPGESLENFPKIVFSFFKDTTVHWAPASYLFRKTGSLFCLGFQSNGAVAETVLGATFMINQLVVFDLQSSRLGLASRACPSFGERPRAPQKLRAGNGGPTVGRSASPASDVSTLLVVLSVLLILLGLCLVARNLLRAYGLRRRDEAASTAGNGASPRRVRARKLGRADEEMQALAEPASPRRSEEVSRIPLDAWLSAGSDDSPTAGSGPCGSEG
eukprot:s440_g15.t1